MELEASFYAFLLLPETRAMQLKLNRLLFVHISTLATDPILQFSISLMPLFSS